MRVCVFDLSSLFWRYARGGTGKPVTDASERTLGKVHQLGDGFDRIVHCCDAGRSWRTAIDPTYKARREDKDAGLVEQYHYVQEALRALGHTVFVGREHPEHKGLYLEADDEIAAVAAWCRLERHSLQIVTNDKDLLRLVDDEADIWCRNHDKDVVCKTDGVYKSLGVAPARVSELLALGGDASDEFKPFPGIGRGTAQRLIAAYGGAIPAMHAILAGGEPLVKLDAPKLAALRSGGTAALDRGFQFANLLVLPGLDFAAVEADPVRREPPPVPAQHALPLAPRCGAPNASAAAPDIQTSYEAPRPSPVPPAAPSSPRAVVSPIAEAQWEETPRQEQARSTALATRRAPVEFMLELEPRTSEDAFNMAHHLAMAGLFQVKKQEQVFAAMLLARSFGLPAITVLQSVYMVDGKLSLPASLIVGLILRSGKADLWKLVESADTRCTIKTHRRDDADPDPVVFTYTEEDARAAGLLGKDNWRKYKRAMLRHRCEVDLARAVYPDVVCNLYTPEELGAID